MVNRKQNKGISLVELMIAVVIFSIMGSAVWLVMKHGYEMWFSGSAQAAVQRDARMLLDYFTKEIRQAKGNTVVIDRNSASDPPFSRVSFTNIDNDIMIYYQSGSRCYESKNGKARRLSSNIRVISFMPVESGDSEVIGALVCLEKRSYLDRSRISKQSSRKIRIMN